ncbi:hypothetical protein B484DRAFT_403287 [Ochromonadaceae sp. CCMP2298]|nr:hypothetical protein B484DRAFT_403287 [Ochromonadaceae sp. CCMP2298]
MIPSQAAVGAGAGAGAVAAVGAGAGAEAVAGTRRTVQALLGPGLKKQEMLKQDIWTWAEMGANAKKGGQISGAVTLQKVEKLANELRKRIYGKAFLCTYLLASYPDRSAVITAAKLLPLLLPPLLHLLLALMLQPQLPLRPLLATGGRSASLARALLVRQLPLLQPLLPLLLEVRLRRSRRARNKLWNAFTLLVESAVAPSASAQLLGGAGRPGADLCRDWLQGALGRQLAGPDLAPPMLQQVLGGAQRGQPA